HGRRREALKEPTVDEKEQNRQRVEKYCALNSSVMDLRSKSVFSTDALNQTRRLLELNTELHTVWNYRRQVFMQLDIWQDPEERQRVLEEELRFLMEIIMKNIKSYWMWNHRVWALSSLPRPEWQRELKLVAKLLAVDARNYHGWDYRRFVVARLKETVVDERVVDEQEFAFTTEQIKRDCANHSAWHNRSKLLPAVLSSTSEAAQASMLEEETKLILNAIYTDPDDQNAWLYYEWLVSMQPSDTSRLILLRNKVTAIRELLELEEDSKRPLIELVIALTAIDCMRPELVTNSEKQECLETLSVLQCIDAYRVGRYSDMNRILAQRWGLAANSSTTKPGLAVVEP
ncbi:Rab geranylgeranyltransferase, partial [Coemansia thaxteri]